LRSFSSLVANWISVGIFFPFVVVFIYNIDSLLLFVKEKMKKVCTNVVQGGKKIVEKGT
jgi:hypothetical protein